MDVKLLIKRFFLVALAAVLAGGCGSGENNEIVERNDLGQDYREGLDLPAPSGGFVLSIGDETITSDKVIAPFTAQLRTVAQRADFEQFSKQVKPDIERFIVRQVSDILLYQQAKREAPDELDEALGKAVDAEVRKFIGRFEGDYAKAEAVLKEMGMDWASFKEYQKRIILRYSYMREQLPKPRPITYSELVKAYNKTKDEVFTTPARVKFQLIDIQPALLDVQDANQSRIEQARQLAKELLEKIDGGEDFGQLAEQYSHGPRQALGGLWKALEPNSLAEPYDILGKRAEEIESGQIAGPIEADGHIFIMRLVNKQARGVEPFEKVQKQIEEQIIKERREKAVYELRVKFVERAALSDMAGFVDFCVEEIYRAYNRQVD